jgi:hypothetical protein
MKKRKESRKPKIFWGPSKEQVGKEQQGRKVAEYAQRQMLSELERELRTEKRKQMEEIVQKSMQEKEKYDHLLTSNEYIEQKLFKIFKQNIGD